MISSRSVRFYDFMGYKSGAPNPEVEEIDTVVAEGIPCPECGNRCHYEGWHKPGSYIALAICNACDHAVEF